VLLFGGAILTWVVYVYFKRKRIREALLKSQMMDYYGNQKGHKRKRGICIGVPIPKMIPMKQAEIRASVELETSDLFNVTVSKFPNF